MSQQKTALITGITGQDGAYLASYLLDLGYRVYGAYRRTSSVNFWRLTDLEIEHHSELSLVECDLNDFGGCLRVIESTKPDEVYNLAAQSFVSVSFEQPISTAQVTGLGAVHLLEAIRIVNPDIRFYQASTSEMFGKVQTIPQSEETPFYPRSPYGIAKLYAHWMTINYRESYNIFGTSGILFNHESELRGQEFVTRKITDSFAKIKQGKLSVLELGNMHAKRDWGYALDYVKGMHAMLQVDIADTFVLATGKEASVKDFVNLTARAAEIELEWSGEGISEVARNSKSGDILVKVNPKFYRPAEVDTLLGDPEKALKVLNWKATTPLEEICHKMYHKDWDRNLKGASF